MFWKFLRYYEYFAVEKCRFFTYYVAFINLFFILDIIFEAYIISQYMFFMRVQMETIEIERLIRSLGIGATYRGYRYLSSGIALCLQDENYLLSVSKLLYPQIARMYHTTSSSVERDLRTVIKVCWERGNKKYLEKLAMHPLDSRPTSGEFIDILVAYINQRNL